MTGAGNLGKEQNKRAWQVIRKLRKLTDEQAKKIKILCNDVIGAHGDFASQLGNLVYVVRFYESLLAQNAIGGVLTAAADFIRGAVDDCNVAVFLADSASFELHVVDKETSIDINRGRLESYFTSEVVDSICRSNKVCSLENMFEMGLVGNLSELGRICAAAVPLGRWGEAVGCILLYRRSENGVKRDELAKVVGITPGLCRAIKACRGRGAHHSGQMGTVPEV